MLPSRGTTKRKRSVHVSERQGICSCRAAPGGCHRGRRAARAERPPRLRGRTREQKQYDASLGTTGHSCAAATQASSRCQGRDSAKGAPTGRRDGLDEGVRSCCDQTVERQVRPRRRRELRAGACRPMAQGVSGFGACTRLWRAAVRACTCAWLAWPCGTDLAP